MVQASCCCGAVRFRVRTPPKMMATCHCSRCRKLGATPFVFVPPSSIDWISGEEVVSVYEPGPPFLYSRCFCSRCGTSLGEIRSGGDMIPIPANCFDEEVGLPNAFHEFVGSKPAWLCIADEAPQFVRHPTKADVA